MKKEQKIIKVANVLSLVVMLPFLGGCVAGGGLGLGALFGIFGGAGAAGGILAALGGGGGVGGLGGALGAAAGVAGAGVAGVGVTEAGLATISNPEPASMILVGSGLFAMKCMKDKQNKA